MAGNYELRDVLDALKEADKAGAVEDAQKLAQIADRLMKSQPEESVQPKPYMAKGFAASLGAPTDLISAGLRGVGLVSPEAPPPFGGSKSIESGLRKIGFDVPTEPPKETGEYVRAGIGEALGMLVPGMGVVKVISRGKGIAANIAKQIYTTMIKHPVATISAEVTGGAGMGAGRKVGEEYPQLGAAAEMLGGVAGGMAPGALAFTPSMLAAKAVKMGAGKISAPFTEAGARFRAGDFLKRQVVDPEASAIAATEKSIGGLPPAVMTGEKRLMSLYKQIQGLDPIQDAKSIEHITKAAFRLEKEIKGLGEGTPEILKAMTEKRIASIELGMDNRTAQSMENAQRKLDALPVASRQAQESIIVRNELTKVMQSEKKLVDDIWLEVPKKTMVGVENTKIKVVDILADLPTAQQLDVPLVLRKHIIMGDDVTSTTINEMQGLRSKLLEISRQARSQGKWNKARIADDVSDAILEDIGITAKRVATTPEGELLNTALAATRKFKERFEQGTVGKILGYDRTSAPSIAPEVTLDIAARGRAVDIDKVVVTPEARAATERYMARSFTDYSLDKNGVVNPARAEKWIKNNEDILDSFPNLRKQLVNIGDAQNLANETKTIMDSRKAALRDPNISVAGRFLGAEVGGEVKRILKSPNPAYTVNQLVRQARKDTTGKALEGLKGGFIEHILDRSSLGGFNELGERTLSGKAVLGFLNENRSVLRQVFPQEQIVRMTKIGRELAKLETLETTKGMGIESNDLVSNLLRYASKIGGAAAGRHLGTKTIQVPGLVSQQWHKIASYLTKNRFEQLVHDAVMSPDGKLLEALLMPLDKPVGKGGQGKEVGIRLNAWLMASGNRVFQDIKEEGDE